MGSKQCRVGWFEGRVRRLLVVALAASAAGCAGGLSGLDYVRVAGPLDSATTKLAVAQCPPGTKVTGGGAYVSPQTPELALIRSEPATGGGGWIAHAVKVSPFAGDWQVGATAICTRVTP